MESINEELKILYKDYIPTYKNSVTMIKRDELKKGKKFSIVSDALFKSMFVTEERIKYSAKLISYFLDGVSYEELVENLTFDKNEFGKEKKDSKGEREDYVSKYNIVA